MLQAKLELAFQEHKNIRVISITLHEFIDLIESNPEKSIFVDELFLYM